MATLLSVLDHRCVVEEGMEVVHVDHSSIRMMKLVILLVDMDRVNRAISELSKVKELMPLEVLNNLKTNTSNSNNFNSNNFSSNNFSSTNNLTEDISSKTSKFMDSHSNLISNSNLWHLPSMVSP